MSRRYPRGLRLVFDASRCDGHGMCSVRCPERIVLDPWGFADVDPTPVDDRRSIRRATAAARSCPAGALHALPVDPPAEAEPVT